MNKWIKKYRYQILAFAIAFIPRLILIFGVMPLRTVTDEMITIAGGAFFSGLDWSPVLSFSGRYYGSGFTMLFWWIFKLTDNPIIIYRVFLFGCVCLQSVTAVFAFDIMYRFLKISNKKFVCIASIACSYCVVTRALIMYNEHVLIFISWLIAWIISGLADLTITKKRRYGLSIILVLTLVYSLTIHTRSYTYWIALGIVILFYLWSYRKFLIPLPMLLFGGVGVIGVNVFLKFLKKGMYLVGEGGYLSNSKVKVGGITYLTSMDYWEGWLDIILGQINTITIITGGFILIGAVIGIYLFWNGLIKKRILTNAGYKKNLEPIYQCLLLYFGVAVIMTIFAQSLSWLGYVGEEMLGISDGSGYGYKAFTYVRYFGPYCGPILLGVLAFLYQFRDWSMRFIKVTMGILSGIQIYWVMVILPVIYNTRYAVEAFLPFSCWDYSEVPRLRTYLAGTLVLIIFLIIILIAYSKKKMILIAALMFLLLFDQYVYNAVFYDDAYRDDNGNYEACDETYEFIKTLEKEIDLPQKIYVYDGRDIENQHTFYEYQFLLNRYTIVPEMPHKPLDEVVLISNTALNLTDVYIEIELDAKEYIYIKGEDLQKAAMNVTELFQ